MKKDNFVLYFLLFHCYNLGGVLFCHWSHWLTNTFTTMHVKMRRNMRWRASIVDSLTDHFTWQMLSYSHMHLVQMFSTESAHLKHDRLITPWNFYKYTRDMYGTALRQGKQNLPDYSRLIQQRMIYAFSKLYAIKFT